METLLWFAIGIPVMFLVAFVWNRFVAKHPTLARLPLEPGETIVADETGLRVYQRGGVRTVQFINCRLRLTDRRIIVAQKMLLGSDEALRYVFEYAPGAASGTDLGTSLREGALFGQLRPEQVEQKEDKTGFYLTFPLGDGPLIAGQIALIYTPNAPKLLETIRRPG